MGNWQLYNTVTTVHYSIVGMELKKLLRRVNIVDGLKIISAGIPDDTLVEIHDPDNNVDFIGFTKRSKVPSDDLTETYTIMERAVELMDYVIEDGGSFDVNWLSLTVNTIVDNILTGTGWTRGSSDTTVIDYITFSYMRKLNGLFYILRDQRSHEVWFDNSTKTVYFGVNRTDRSSTDVDYITKVTDRKSFKQNYDKVVVLGSAASITGEAGIAGKTVVYEYKEAGTAEECTRVAIQLLAFLGTTKVTEELKLVPTSLYDEGDKVKVDGTIYTVFEVREKLDGTTLVVGAMAESFADIFGDQVREVVGTADVGNSTETPINGGWQNVGASADAKWNIEIDDTSLVQSIVLNLGLDKYKKMMSADNSATGNSNVDNDTGDTVDDGTAVVDNADTAAVVTIADETDIPMVSVAILNSATSTFWSLTSAQPNLYWPISSSNLTPSTSSSTAGAAYSLGDHSWSYALLYCTIYSTTSSVWKGVIYFQWYNGSSWTTMSATNVEIRGDESQHFTMVGFAVGATGSPTRQYRVRTQRTAGDGAVGNYSMGIFKMGRHDHSNTGVNHDHIATSNPHPHSMFAPDHGHGQSDPLHGHTENDDISEIASYPSTVVVYVNGINVGTHVGGSKIAFDTSEIKTHLVNGSNEIKVVSATAGSVYLSGVQRSILI